MSSSSNRENFIKLTEKRVLQNQARAIRDERELEIALNEAYKKAKEDLMVQINTMRERMPEWSMAEASKFDRLNKLLKNINNVVDDLGRTEVADTSSHLTDLYEDRYLRSIYTLGQSGVNVKLDLTHINKKAVKEAINYPWSGAMFSERIWDNKALLVKNIKEGITQSLILGESMPKLANRINKGINTSNFNALRVARTESMRVSYVADRKAYESEGIEQVKYCSYIDHRTSSYCKEHDGEIYSLGSEPMLPAHPHCRSTYIPILPDIDYGEGIIRKNKGAKVLEESNNFDEFRERALEEQRLSDKYNGEVGKEISKKAQIEYNRRNKAYLDSIMKANESTYKTIDKALNSSLYILEDKERLKLLDIQKELARYNEVLADRDNFVFTHASENVKKKLKYKLGSGNYEMNMIIYPVQEFKEMAGGKYYLSYGQKLGKKEATKIEKDIEDFLKVNPRATGVRVNIDNKVLDTLTKKKSRGITLGYYIPEYDAITMRTYTGYEKIYQERFKQEINGRKEFLETFTHELAHRVHSTNEAVSHITFKGSEWEDWKKLVEPYYKKYREDKEVDIRKEWHRFGYPVNAQDFYKDGDKKAFYQEMWAESSSVLHAFGEGIDQEKEIALLEKYFPNVREFVEGIYKK